MVVVSSHGADTIKLTNPLEVANAGRLHCSSALRLLVGDSRCRNCCAEPRVLNAKEESRVKQVFEKIDKDNSGHIDLDEVCMMLAYCSIFSCARIAAVCTWLSVSFHLSGHVSWLLTAARYVDRSRRCSLNWVQPI